MGRDIGSYFETMTRKARGGRRLTTGRSSTREPDRGDERSSGSGSSPRGTLKDIVGDVLGRGRATATKTAKRATEKVRSTRRRPPARRLPPEGVVAIEYSPQIDGDPDPGEVVWTWVPFEEDPEQGKDRPVVVIGRRGRNLVGVPLTTKRNDREAQISIGTGGWDPKRRPSYARIWRMLDLDDDHMRREGAILDQRRFDQVIAAVDEYYDVRRVSAPSNGPRSDDDFEYDY
jgi:hypothetical protein